MSVPTFDIISDTFLWYSAYIFAVDVNDFDVSVLSKNAQILIAEFQKSNSQYFDIITADCELSGAEAIAALTELEIMGIVTAQPGGRYILNIGG